MQLVLMMPIFMSVFISILPPMLRSLWTGAKMHVLFVNQIDISYLVSDS